MFKSASGISDYLKENKRTLILIFLFCLLAVFLSLLSPSEGTKAESPEGEERLEALVGQVEGVGECEVMISYDGERAVGVIILCEGAESASVRARLCDLVSSLYGIGANRISILKIAR